jgi:hypothetical protein
LEGDRRGGPRGLPEYKAQTNFPHPWEGGWWRLRDIVEQQKISSWALLDMAARNKETVLWNAYQKAKRQSERGERGETKAYIIPSQQHDPLTREKLVENLLIQGVEIHKAAEDFMVGATRYDEGSYLLYLDQPKMGLINTLLGETHFPDGPWTRERDGTPISPFDTATDTMAEFMGIRVDPVSSRPDVQTTTVAGYTRPVGTIKGDSDIGYLFDTRLNDSYWAVNMLLDEGLELKRFDEPVTIDWVDYPQGCFMALTGSEDVLAEVAEETGVDFIPLDSLPEVDTHTVKRMQTAMYQRYWGGNMDEGWTRWMLEQFNYPYTTIMDEEIRKGGLWNYDILILPNDSTTMITGEGAEERWREERAGYGMFPPEYRSGIGEEGVEAVKEFVKDGGTLLCFGEACNFAMEKMELRIKNVVGGLDSKEFFCPGSTLHARVDVNHPLGYGMPKDPLVLFWNVHDRDWKCPAFEILPSDQSQNYEKIVELPDSNLLKSGWLIGEDKIAGKGVMISVKYGDGKIILIGIRPQHRAQTHGTFKLVFNALTK